MINIITQEELRIKYRLSELEAIFQDIIKTIETVKDKDGKDSKQSTYLLYTLGKAITTARETLMLVFDGYPDGALSISRNLFEQFIITAFIFSCNNDIDAILSRYDEDYEVQRLKNLKFWDEHISKDEKAYRDHKKQLELIANKYDKKPNELRDYWWCDCKSFYEICERVILQNKDLEDLIRKMQMLYKRACISIHSSCIGNVLRIGGDFEGVDFGPWSTGHEVSLYLSVMSLVYIVCLTYDFFDVPGEDFSDIKHRLNELGSFYNDIMDEEARNRAKG